MAKLIVTLALWFIGLLAAIFVLDRIGVPEKVIGFAATGAFIGLLAHIRTTENWKQLRRKDIFSRSTWIDEANVVRNAVRPTFESASERAWFVLLIACLALMLLSYITYGLGHRHNLVEAISRGSRSASPFDVVFLAGCAGAIVGALFSYFRKHVSPAYRATLGRVVAWVRSGS